MPISRRLAYLTKCALVLSYVCAGLRLCSQSQARKPEHEFVYVAGEASELSFTLPLRAGQSLIIRLDPDFTDGHQVFGFDLEARTSSDKPDTNLLEPYYKHWHGIQSFMFISNCFVKSSAGCGFSNMRDFELPKLRLKLSARVTQVEVEPTANAKTDTDYRFKKLTLDLTTTSMRPSKHSRSRTD